MFLVECFANVFYYKKRWKNKKTLKKRKKRDKNKKRKKNVFYIYGFYNPFRKPCLVVNVAITTMWRVSVYLSCLHEKKFCPPIGGTQNFLDCEITG